MYPHLSTFLCLLLSAGVCSAQSIEPRIFTSKLTLNEVQSATPAGQSSSTLVTAAGNGGLNQPHGIVPRGFDILVASYGTDSVKSFDRISGQFRSDFLTAASGLNDPVQLKMGPDNRLYISSQGNDRILRFNVNTGTAADASPFIAGGLLDGPSGFDWSPDKSVLYVAGRYSGNLLAYHAATGAPLATGHIVAQSLGAGNTYGVAVAPSGHIFVATSGQIRRYSSSGALIQTISLSAVGLELEPGGQNILAAVSNNIRRISVATGTFSGGLLSPATSGIINFFSFPPPDFGAELLTVTSGGQRYLAVKFQVNKYQLGASCVQTSSDLNTWSISASWLPDPTEGVRREYGTGSALHEMQDLGDRVIITERDITPVGTQNRRFFAMRFGCP